MKEMAASAQVMEMVPMAAFAPGIRPITLADKDEEEQRSQEGNVLLEAFADNVGANALRDEVVAELEDVRELAVRNKRELASGDEHQCGYQDQRNQHVQDVLGYVPARNGKDRRRVELRREMLCLLDEL